MGIIFNSSYSDCNKIIASFIDTNFINDYGYNPADTERLKDCPFVWGLGDDGIIYCKTSEPLADSLCMKANVWNEINTIHLRVLKNCRKMHEVSSRFHKLLVFL